MKKFLFNKKRQVILLAISILVILVNLSLIFNDSVWYDEAYTMNLVRVNFFDILNGTSIDLHPPLYYFSVKFFTLIFGYSVPDAKLASITPVFLTMLLVIFVLDKQLGIVVSAEHIGKNVQIRHCTPIGITDKGCPTIGDNVIVGANAVTIGNITIGDNCTIGAESVVTKSVDSNCIVAGNPVRVIGINRERQGRLVESYT